MIDRNSCGYVPRNELTKKGKENERVDRIECEHIMPAENFGRHLPCWREGGRKACSKDPIFNKMEADMHNLVPAIGELNDDIATAYFYMSNTYNIKLSDQERKLMEFGINKTQLMNGKLRRIEELANIK